MRRSNRVLWGVIGVGVLATGVAIVGLTGPADAADHQEAPNTVNNPLFDVGDLYAWHHDGRLTVAMTFDGYRNANMPSEYSADALYTLHLDTNDDQSADHEIHVRFGQDGGGNWGVQAEGIPGESGALVGAIDTNLEGEGGALFFAGTRDDPFFFDHEGFLDTLDTGTLMFDADRDRALLTNTSVAVVEFDLAALGSDNVQVWATSATK